MEQRERRGLRRCLLCSVGTELGGDQFVNKYFPGGQKEKTEPSLFIELVLRNPTFIKKSLGKMHVPPCKS